MDETKNKRTKAIVADRREPRSPRERAQWLGAYRASGLTQERFAARAGLKIGTLRAWIYKPRRAPVRPAGGHFAPVRIVDEPAGAKAPGTVTVRWPQGLTVEIVVPLDDTGVRRLVRELVAPCLR